MASSSSPSSISPPSLLQSSVSSTADTRNVQILSTPNTPPRGRSRYPSSLAHDGLRVPLHRRGTSKTYERLEDLLKEAGYKETRIFTPETERHREHERGQGEGRQSDGKLRNGVDAVVGYLAGLVLGQADGEPADLKAPRSDREGQATLVSPPTRKHKTPLDISSSLRASSSQIRGAQGHPLTSSGITDSGHLSNARASGARAYLRHIASAPNIPRRRPLEEHAHTALGKKSATSLKDGHHTLRSPVPPLPTSWLGTVTRAVLGFPGARIGGPNNVPSHSPPLLPPVRSRLGHSSLPRGRSSPVSGLGRSNRKRPASPLEDTAAGARGRSIPSLPKSLDPLQPPTILAMRSNVSPGQVVRINVVCHSTPASRSSSVVRHEPGSDSLASTSLGNLSSGTVRGKGKAPQAGRKYRHNKQEHLTDGGPSLSGRVEDGFTLHSPEDRGDCDSSSDDEDEGEVDLSKLLVHSRRQRSIRSLRRHLERVSRPRGEDSNSFHVNGTWTLHGGDDSAIAPEGGGRIRRGSVNDGDWGVLVAPGTGRDSRSLHRRREIPVSWTQQNGGSKR